MFTDSHALYRLLPAYIRQQDQKNDQALEQLLAIVGSQAAALQRDLERMYDGWFIETCDEWLIPYIGDLLGLEPAHLAPGQSPGAGTDQMRLVLSARAATANAIAQRRRQGTLWVLEEIGRDLAHWPARAVELYRQSVAATHLDHLQPSRLATAEIRSARRLAGLNGPFDELCHLNAVRRIGNAQSRDVNGVANVALFVWRLRPYSVTDTTAYCREEIGTHCFTFSALGNDTQLLRAPTPETGRTAIARAEHLPVPITRWMLEADPPPGATKAEADQALYGDRASLVVKTEDWPARGARGAGAGWQEVPAAQIIPADLTDWAYRVPKGHVAVDPVLGRIAFPVSQPPRRGVRVSYRYGFAMDIGGGEYLRAPVPLPRAFERLHVWSDVKTDAAAKVFATIAEAYEDWNRRRSAPDAKDQPPAAAVIELMASGVYKGRFDLELRAGETVAVIAAPGARPILWLPDDSPGTSDAITIRGSRGSRVILDGLLVAGRSIEVGDRRPQPEDGGEYDECDPGPLCELWIRHTTLLPGNGLHPNCDPKRPSEPSLVIDDTTACVRMDSSIVGAIRVLHEGTAREPARIEISDSIVDATGEERMAIGGAAAQAAYADVSVRRSTVVGRVVAHTMPAAEDSIFTSRVEVVRKQVGCLRFCYVTPDSRTPRRYMCQPDLALGAVDVEVARRKELTESQRAALVPLLKATALLRVAPAFASMRYGSANYLRLSDCAGPELARGAHDESELGVYHDLFEPRRQSMLGDRLAEFVPASRDAAVVFVS